MNAKEEFIQIYKENIHREGADAFLEFLEGPHSDFFSTCKHTISWQHGRWPMCA